MKTMGLCLLGMTVAGALPAAAEIPFPKALERAAVAFTTLDDPINDALIIGNGDLNALVFAEGEDLMIRITKNDVWDARLDTPLNPPLPTLARLLELGHGDWPDREYILPKDSTWKGPDSYQAHAYPCPRACGVLRVPGAAKGPLVGRLDIRRARIDVYSSTGAYRVYIPADANTIVIEKDRSSAEGPEALACVLSAIQSDDIPPAETGSDRDVAWVSQQIPGDLDWPGMAWSVALAQNEDRAVASAVTSLANPEPGAAAVALASQTLEADAAVRQAEHESAWTDFWGRSGLNLGDEVLERVWYRNLYFLRCVSKPGVVSTGLFAGLLDDKPAWHGDYHTNYNIQQTYWAAYAANQCELTEPYDRLITGYLPRARWLARSVFDLDGAYIPHVLFAYETPDPAASKMPGGRQYIHHVWGFTQGVNGFSVQPLWWHYKYAPDRAFLRDVAYPAVRDVADFQAAFIDRCERAADNHAVLAPTVSPEHWGWTPNFERNKNCTFDIAMFRFIFHAAIEGAATLGVDADKVTRWREAEELLPDYPAWSDDPQTVVDVEGAPPIEYNIPVPTTPVFPCDVVTFAASGAERARFAHTLENLKDNGNNAPTMLAVARARLSTPDALDYLRSVVDRRERRNGTLSFNRLDPRFKFNDFGHYTEMFGAALPVCELLLQSVGDVIRVFPAWPGHLPAEFRSLRAQGGFLVSASQVNGAVGEIRIESTAGGALRILPPWKEAEWRRDVEGVGWGLAGTQDDGTIRIDTTPGNVILFRQKAS